MKTEFQKHETSAAAFPRDRISMQQPGELGKLERDYQGAPECFAKKFFRSVSMVSTASGRDC